MQSEKPKEIIITENSIKFRRIFFLMIISSTMLGLFILIILQFLMEENPSEKEFYLELFILILLIVSLGLLGIIYLRLIPKARKIREPFHRFQLHSIIFILGVESFGLFGLITGLIQLFLGNNKVDWFVVGFFFNLAILNALILYLTEINPTLNACEIGKRISASPHDNGREE